MSTRIFDATCYIADDDSMQTSSSDYHTLLVNGDTIRLATQRTPSSSSDAGYTGEVCIDSNYIYVCVATNTWKRASLGTF